MSYKRTHSGITIFGVTLDIRYDGTSAKTCKYNEQLIGDEEGRERKDRGEERNEYMPFRLSTMMAMSFIFCKGP